MGTDRPSIDVSHLRSEVQLKYGEVAGAPAAGHHFHTGRRALRQVGYDPKLYERLPEEAVDAFAGVADVFHWGLPRPGERVVDVGCGAGTDALIAADAVGADGAVVGVDMSAAMLERASRAAGARDNLELREGYAEDLPVADGWADLVISNGALNLVPDKLAAYREIFRVLRPGGRLQIGDICVERPVPEGAQRDIDLWTA
jgi:arsenite methyltransferase